MQASIFYFQLGSCVFFLSFINVYHIQYMYQSFYYRLHSRFVCCIFPIWYFHFVFYDVFCCCSSVFLWFFSTINSLSMNSTLLIFITFGWFCRNSSIHSGCVFFIHANARAFYCYFIYSNGIDLYADATHILHVWGWFLESLFAL